MDSGSHKRGTLTQSRACPDFALVTLHDLVDDGQSQAGAAIEPGLKGLEDFLGLLRAHAVSGVSKVDLPIVPDRFQRHGEGTAVLHRAYRVLAEVPEHLPNLVAVGKGHGLIHPEMAHDHDAGIFR